MSIQLDNRVLNRTLLARQHLLARTTADVATVVEHLIGLQAQDVPPPFVALWSRVADFDPDIVDRGLEDRSLARITLMRGTIHLVTARDARRIAPHIQPELEKAPFRKGFNFGATVGLDPEEVRAAGEAALGAEPMSAAELRELAQQRWPDRNGSALLQTWLYLLPVLQVPPRGKWRNNSRPTWCRIESWLGPVVTDYPVDDLVLRYLRAFGPASTMDMQSWSRLTGFKEVVERLGDQLRTYTDDRGRTLYDVADGVLEDPDRPAPVRYLSWYDNALLSHKDRARIVPESVDFSVSGTLVSSVLVDGFLAGLYKVYADKDVATLRMSVRAALTKRQAADVEAEGLRLLAFLEPEREHRYELVGADETFAPRR